VAWNKFSAGPTDYDLSHLSPFTLSVTPKAAEAPTFKVLVSFGHHTFTRELNAADPLEMRFSHNNDTRCFCPVRHGHSQELPRIVTEGATGRAYFSQTRNYLLVENLPGVIGPYAVFFNIERAKNLKAIDATLFVVSAYPKPGLPPKRDLPAITFATLVSKTVAGHEIRRPKK
jgi:hypothetical protein